MKHFMIVLLAVSMVGSSGLARKKKPKAGKIRDGIYYDSKYKFQITMLEEWKVKVRKESDVCRLSLTLDKYEIPQGLYPGIYSSGPEQGIVTEPLIEVWLIETNLSCHDQLDSLLSFSYKSKVKEKFLMAIHPNWADAKLKGIETTKRTNMRIADRKGVYWLGIYDFSFDLLEMMSNNQ